MKKTCLLMMGFLLALPAVTSAAGAIQPARPNTVRFYQDYHCTSAPYVEVPKGSKVPDLRQWTKPAPGGPSWDDQISCIVIGAGVRKVTVYENIHYTGKSKTFSKTRGNPLGAWSLAGDWWKDKISSIKIQ